MSKTNFSRNKIQDYLFGGVSFTAPATYYMGLSTTIPSVSGSNFTEPAGAGYARVSFTSNKTNFGYSSSGCVVNSASIVFPETSGSWGTILSIGLFDASTSGSLWEYSVLSTPKVVQDTTVISFSAGAIAASMT